MGQLAVEQRRLIGARIQAEAEALKVGTASLMHKISWAPYYIRVRLSPTAIASIIKTNHTTLEGGIVSPTRAEHHGVLVREQSRASLLEETMHKIIKGERKGGETSSTKELIQHQLMANES
jgi:hypothetical protein